jgi:AcrR family transcriptional regulator
MDQRQIDPSSLGLFGEEAGVKTSDGRHLRRDANRLRVVEALVELFSEGNPKPTAGEIAVRAEISERSIFRYFADLRDLERAAVERYVRDAFPYALIPHPRPEDPRGRLELLVETRAALHNHIEPVASISRNHFARNDVLGESIKKVRDLLRFQIAMLFDPELSTLGEERERTLYALDLTFSFETWFFIRQSQELSHEQAKEITFLSGERILRLS